MAQKTQKRYRHVLCLMNPGYPSSLEVGKVYPVLPDAQASRHGLVRVVDESGEDYLYPANWFKQVELSAHEHELICGSASREEPVAAAINAPKKKK